MRKRFIVDEQILQDATKNVGGRFLEPIKTTNVENLRCMTTWVLVRDWPDMGKMEVFKDAIKVQVFQGSFIKS